MSATTFIKGDIVTTLQSLNLVQYWRGQVRRTANPPLPRPPSPPAGLPDRIARLSSDLCLFVRLVHRQPELSTAGGARQGGADLAREAPRAGQAEYLSYQPRIWGSPTTRTSDGAEPSVTAQCTRFAR